MSDADGIPRAYVTLDQVRARGTLYWQWIVIRCPFCKEQHRHGAGEVDWDNPRAFLDIRTAHCEQRLAKQYQLVELEE
jgi:hypothetical protein